MLKPGAEKFDTKEIMSSIFVDYPKQEWVGGGYSCPGVGEVTKVGEFLHSSYAQLYQLPLIDRVGNVSFLDILQGNSLAGTNGPDLWRVLLYH